MLPGRDLYKMVNGLYENSIGLDVSMEDIVNESELFLIDDSLYGTESDRTLFLFTKQFVIRVEQTIDFGDIYKESGNWTKEYEAYNVSDKYSRYSDKMSDDDIMRWVNKNALEFI